MKRNKKVKSGKISFKSIVTIFIILLICGAIFTNKVFAIEEIPTKNYVVTSNDTLWKIASKICKKSDNKDLNTQKVVYEIKELNSLTTSDIYVGQELVIPIY